MISNKAASLAQMNGAFNGTIANGLLHISLFKGVMPSMDKVFDNMYPVAVDGLLNWRTCCTQLGLVQADHLGDVTFPTMNISVNANSRTVTLPLYATGAQLVGAVSGTPTFYVARIIGVGTVAAWLGFNYNANITGAFWIGTVGPEGSDAELQFIGGEIEAGQKYTFRDLMLQL